MSLAIVNTPALIGGSINTRTEKHGDENVTAMDIPLSGIMIGEAELCALLGDQGALAALFGDNDAPRFPTVKSLVIEGKFENATVAIEVGLMREVIELDQVRLAKIRLAPKQGLLTELSLTVQCTPDLEKQILTLLKFLGHDCQATITFGEHVLPKDKQRELELSLPKEGEQVEETEEAEEAA